MLDIIQNNSVFSFITQLYILILFCDFCAFFVNLCVIAVSQKTQRRHKETQRESILFN